MRSTRRRPFLAIVLVACSLASALVLAEAYVRLTTPQVRLFDTRNFAFDPVGLIDLFPMVEYHPTLGFVHKADYRPVPFADGRGGFGPMGNRLSRPVGPDGRSPPVPQGVILAVGDSFTFGSEVEPEESWPAGLEDRLGIAVVNAGQGGYGVDQIALNIERLALQVHPRLVIASFIVDTIDRAELSVYSGAGKPYFEMEDGRLTLRNTPVQPYVPTSPQYGWLRRILGHSFLVSWIFDRVGLGGRWRVRESRPAHRDGDAVACALMARMAAAARTDGYRVVVVAQYGRDHLEDLRRSAKLTAMLGCARTAGLPTLDSRTELLRIQQADRERLGRFYAPGGHMSAAGNAFMADLLANFLRSEMPHLVAAMRAP